jgi:hypothetical protein
MTLCNCDRENINEEEKEDIVVDIMNDNTEIRNEGTNKLN